MLAQETGVSSPRGTKREFHDPVFKREEKMAEEEGFEPSLRFHVNTRSRRAP